MLVAFLTLIVVVVLAVALVVGVGAAIIDSLRKGFRGEYNK